MPGESVLRRGGQSDVEVTPESSPVHESIPGRGRGGGRLCHRRDEVVGQDRGANDTIRLAVAGLNGRGGSHVEEFGKIPGVEIRYLVDPDTRTYQKRLDQIEKNGGRAPATVQDIRRVLEDKSVDAVSVATPNHWHALITIWSCQAGKDVYVEKPCSHNIHEGRRGRRSRAAVQPDCPARHAEPFQSRLGTGRRSDAVGKAREAASFACSLLQASGSIGVKPFTSQPEQLDFDIWLGPAAASRIMPTWSITTGIGSGISATATSATKASTKWIKPAG